MIRDNYMVIELVHSITGGGHREKGLKTED